MAKSPSGMLNITQAELGRMEKYPNEKAIEYGKREPYYLQYIREQKEKENNKKS